MELRGRICAIGGGFEIDVEYPAFRTVGVVCYGSELDFAAFVVLIDVYDFKFVMVGAFAFGVGIILHCQEDDVVVAERTFNILCCTHFASMIKGRFDVEISAIMGGEMR